MTKRDTRLQHSATLDCYCDECTETAENWYVWADSNDDAVEGARYWTPAHAAECRPAGAHHLRYDHD